LLEGRDGATLARLREAHRCLVIVLAERGDEVDEIVALELGADAFLRRPLSPRRLRAHLAVLMRLQSQAAVPTPAMPARWNVGPDGGPLQPSWQLDRIGNRLLRGKHEIALTELQSALLQCLLEAHGRIVTRDRLMAALPLGKAVNPRSMDVYLYRLRRRLLAAGVADWQIEGVRGRGYVLRSPAEPAAA
jgi:DNA-binding response OmpR family regulator